MPTASRNTFSVYYIIRFKTKISKKKTNELVNNNNENRRESGLYVLYIVM